MDREKTINIFVYFIVITIWFIVWLYMYDYYRFYTNKIGCDEFLSMYPGTRVSAFIITKCFNK